MMIKFRNNKIEKKIELDLEKRAEAIFKQLGCFEEYTSELVRKAKEETLLLTNDLATITYGDKVIKNEGYVKAREVEGLTKNDIREY